MTAAPPPPPSGSPVPPARSQPRWAAAGSALRLAWPLHWLALFSGAKDFSRNPVIGSARLNRWGLHRLRARLAHGVSDLRRRVWLQRRLPADQVARFGRDGFVALADFLPEAQWQAVRAELREAALPMIETVQGHTLTRRANLDTHACDRRYPALASLLRDARLARWLRYASGCPGQPLIALQCVHARPDGLAVSHDPQTDWHSDTFQSAGKAWLFLHDVGADQGPFGYWPGSQQAGPARLNWEHAQSIDAAQHPNRMHARGSLRASEAELAAMAQPAPFIGAVAGNTLVVADTGGFHRRTPSDQATVRLEIYLSLRRNPYFAGLYPSALTLPVVRQRWAGWVQAYYEWRWAHARQGVSWRPAAEPGLLPSERARIGG